MKTTSCENYMKPNQLSSGGPGVNPTYTFTNTDTFMDYAVANDMNERPNGAIAVSAGN